MLRNWFLALVTFLLWQNAASADDSQTDLSSQLQPYQTESQLVSKIGIEQDNSIFDFDIVPKSQMSSLLATLSNDDANISVLKQAYDTVKQENKSLSLEIQKRQQSPEDCILGELRNAQASGDETETVRFNCIRRYVLTSMASATDVFTAGPPNNFSDARLTYGPEIQSIPPEQPSISVALVNETAFQIIAVEIVITGKSNSNDAHTYMLYADYPIDSETAGTLTAEVLIDPPDATTFWSTYNWSFLHVWGVLQNE